MDIIIIYQLEEQIKGVDVTQSYSDGADFMCLCRCETVPEGVTVLGTYDEVFADADKKAVYDRFYQVENQVEDMRFGEFA